MSEQNTVDSRVLEDTMEGVADSTMDIINGKTYVGKLENVMQNTAEMKKQQQKEVESPTEETQEMEDSNELTPAAELPNSEDLFGSVENVGDNTTDVYI